MPATRREATSTAARRKATPTADQWAQWADERQAKLADLHGRIVERVTAMTNGEQWRDWLQFATKFHSYSFNNTIAIWMQAPDATFVAGIKRWNELGRRVRKGETGIAILAPITARKINSTDTAEPAAPAPTASLGPAGIPGVIELTGASVTAFIEAALSTLDASVSPPAGRILRGFKIATVFEISQTDGPDIEVPARPGRIGFDGVTLLTGQAPAGVWDALVGIAGEHGYRVERGDCDDANGYIRWADHLIRVRDDVDDAQAVKTLTHELGHMLLHDPDDFVDGSTRRCRGEKRWRRRAPPSSPPPTSASTRRTTRSATSPDGRRRQSPRQARRRTKSSRPPDVARQGRRRNAGSGHGACSGGGGARRRRPSAARTVRHTTRSGPSLPTTAGWKPPYTTTRACSDSELADRAAGQPPALMNPTRDVNPPSPAGAGARGDRQGG